MNNIDLKKCLNLTTKYNEFFITQLKIGAAVLQKYGDDYKLLQIADIISKNKNQIAFASIKNNIRENTAIYSTTDDEYYLEFVCAR